jgi:DNA-binding transcriptional MerR regulator
MSTVADYRVDELARLAGTTVRNVRVYQDRGLLPPPRRQGRVGIYGEAHLARLRLVGSLLERGFTFSHIADFLAALQRGDELSDVLGLEAAITEPWTEEEPITVNSTELRRMFTTLSPRLVTRALRSGLIVREGTHFRVPSPSLLRAGADLVAAGMPVEAVLDLAENLRRDTQAIASHFVEAVLSHVVGEDLPSGEQAAVLAANVRRLRPHARSAVLAAFARAMQEEVAIAIGERVAGALQEP